MPEKKLPQRKNVSGFYLFVLTIISINVINLYLEWKTTTNKYAVSVWINSSIIVKEMDPCLCM